MTNNNIFSIFFFSFFSFCSVDRDIFTPESPGACESRPEILEFLLSGPPPPAWMGMGMWMDMDMDQVWSIFFINFFSGFEGGGDCFSFLFLFSLGWAGEWY